MHARSVTSLLDARSSRRRFLTTSGLVAASLVAAGLPGARSVPTVSAQGPVTIRISYQPILIASPHRRRRFVPERLSKRASDLFIFRPHHADIVE